MSQKGIERFAQALSDLQTARNELLNMGAENIDKEGAKSGNQDIRLGQMCDEMKDLVKEEFSRITLEEV